MIFVILVILAMLIYLRLWYVTSSLIHYVTNRMIKKIKLHQFTPEELDSFTTDELVYNLLEASVRVWGWSSMCCIRKNKRSHSRRMSQL